MSRLDAYINSSLEDMENQSLKRGLRNIQSSRGMLVTIDGNELINFCANNYLGLADDPRLKEAAVHTIKNDTFGAGASRLVCGNMSAHRALEEGIARFKGTEDCLAFSSGYMANIGIIASLFGKDDLILCDRLNHASIIDGILLSQAKYKRYPHTDMKALEELLKESAGTKRRAIITDSVFSMDGDLAPLDVIVRLAKKYDCLVMIDEAHAFGVMGEKGRGLAEHFGVERSIDIHMGTLSKAAGSFGAYVTGSRQLIEFFINKARSFIYTTGMPPSVAAASLKAVEIIRDEPELRSKLWVNTNIVKEGLTKLGFNTMNSESPIIPILLKESKIASDFSKHLLAEGIFVSAIRPPTVPVDTARLRISVSARHTQKQIDQLLNAMKEIGRKLCLI